MRTISAVSVALAIFCFALGITLPLMEVKRLWLITDSPSLLAVIAGLWATGDRLLAIVICLFSVALPATKLALLQAGLAGRGLASRVERFMHAIARWSMLDVVLVALVIFSVRTSGLATAIGKPGLWFFAASIVLTAAASAGLRRAGADGSPNPWRKGSHSEGRP